MIDVIFVVSLNVLCSSSLSRSAFSSRMLRNKFDLLCVYLVFLLLLCSVLNLYLMFASATVSANLPFLRSVRLLTFKRIWRRTALCTFNAPLLLGDIFSSSVCYSYSNAKGSKSGSFADSGVHAIVS